MDGEYQVLRFHTTSTGGWLYLNQTLLGSILYPAKDKFLSTRNLHIIKSHLLSKLSEVIRISKDPRRLEDRGPFFPLLFLTKSLIYDQDIAQVDLRTGGSYVVGIFQAMRRPKGVAMVGLISTCFARYVGTCVQLCDP